MTAPPPWRLPDPPKRRRSWLPEPDALPEPMEAASAPARRVSRDVRTTAPDGVRNADRFGTPGRYGRFMVCTSAFRALYDGEVTTVTVGERVKECHPLVRCAPECFKVAPLQRGEVTPETKPAAKLNHYDLALLQGNGLVR